MAFFEKIITKIVNGFVVVALTAMIVLAFLQIILRNFFSSGIGWADVTIRHLVLWIGFFGAVLAAIQERHISLDVFSRVLPDGVKKYIHSIIYLGSAVVCGILSFASYKFVVSEKEMGAILFGGVPVWLAQVIVPCTFVMIGAVFLVKSARGIITNDQ